MTEPPVRVLVYLHPDARSEHKQQKAVLSYCAEHGLEIHGSVTSPEAAAQAVRAGIAATVVAATDPRNGLRHLVSVAGGRALFVRERSRTPTLREFLGRAVGIGRTASQIAQAIGSETTEINELIKRLGLRIPRDRTN